MIAAAASMKSTLPSRAFGAFAALCAAEAAICNAVVTIYAMKAAIRIALASVADSLLVMDATA